MTTYYEKLMQDMTYKGQITDKDKSFIKEIEKVLNFSKFRYYQKEAMNVFDFFYNQGDDYYFKKQLKDPGEDIPYYGFEMATGSGKTYLIGAKIAYLKSKGIKNFLILTPNTTIYHKTIKNFDVNNKKCIFTSNLNFKYNLITGEDYTGRSNSYDPNIDTNIFVFNIQKFFDRVKGEKGESALKIKKAWEQGALKDDDGNVISLYDFLVNKELAIITDEAHHYQQKKSSEVIKDLKPSCVLEFTATAIEDDVWRKKQKIIYKYSVNKYINDGFGKKIRAFGHDTPDLEKIDKKEISKADKEKIIISLLIHQIKKKALKNLKPILVIRARDLTEHADKVLKFITEELPYEDSLIEEVFEQLNVDEKYDIIHLIKEHIPSIDQFKNELKKLKERSISYHNNSTAEENQKLENIEDNDVEVVVQVKKLEEGWNVDTVYTILILNYGQSEIKTYVKQLIGRGLRLPNEKRLNPKEPLPEQTEILHVVCEKGNNFSAFIEQIKKDMELTGESLEAESQTEEYSNKTILTDIKKHNELKLPIYSKESKLKFTATDILKKLTYENLKIGAFIKRNTQTFKNHKVLLFEGDEQNIEESFLGESKSLIAKEREHSSKISLTLTEQDFNRLIDLLISNNPILPGLLATKEILTKTLLNINKEDLKYKTRYEGREEEKRIIQIFLSKLYKHLADQINSMFEFVSKLKSKPLKELFKGYEINKKTDVESGEIINLVHKSKEVPKKDLRRFYFNGYGKSFFEYNWFESSQEKVFAGVIDNFEDVEFWIRNTRQYYLEHGMKRKYYPDFIVKTKNELFLVEIKGTVYIEDSEENINLLRDLDLNEKIKTKGVLFLDTTVDKKITNKAESFSQIVENNDLHSELTKKDKEKKESKG